VVFEPVAFVKGFLGRLRRPRNDSWTDSQRPTANSQRPADFTEDKGPMTTEHKPSRNEEEYFAKLEAERMDRKRQEQSRLAEDAEKKSHYMRCPKCGGHLATVELHRVQVDRCPDCHGLWLDNGEIDAVIKGEDKGRLGRALGEFMSSLKGK